MKESLGCLGLIVLLVFLIFIEPILVFWLWGLIMVPVFGLPALSFWQAFGLTWLAHLLFKNVSYTSKD